MKAIKILLSITIIIFFTSTLFSCGSVSSSGEVYEVDNTFYTFQEKLDFLEEWIENALNQREITGSEEQEYIRAAKSTYAEIIEDLKNYSPLPDEKKQLNRLIKKGIKNQILDQK